MRPSRILAILLAALAIAAGGVLFLRHDADPHAPRAVADADAPPVTAAPSSGDTPAGALAAPDAAQATDRPSATAAQTTSPSLPAIESRFLRNGQVQLDALRGTLTSDRFDRDFETLDNAMRQSADAVALRDAYRDAIARQAARAGLAEAPQRLACGMDVCLGSVVVRHGDAGYATWWNDFTSSSTTPQGTAIDFPRTLADGRIEHRFFFSMDPAANRAILPNPR